MAQTIKEDSSKKEVLKKEDKLKALDGALAQIEKQFGKGSVMKLGDYAANIDVETVPTGALSLDIALGLGGDSEGKNRGSIWARIQR